MTFLEKSVSRNHAFISYVKNKNKFQLTHLSKNAGSFLKIQQNGDLELQLNDILEIGSNELKVVGMDNAKCVLTVIMGMP